MANLACLLCKFCSGLLNALLDRAVLILYFHRAAAEVSGSSFYYLEGAAALLEVALIQFAMQKAVAKVFYMFTLCK